MWVCKECVSSLCASTCVYDPYVCIGRPPYLDAEECVETRALEGTCSPKAPQEPSPNYAKTS